VVLLTEKQKRFADEYLIDLNATRAYKVAYPNVKKDDVAKAAASRMLTNVNVKNYVDEQLEKISNAKIADAMEVMEYLTKGIRQELEEEVVVVEGCGDGCSGAAIVKKKISLKDSNKCAELLAKRYSLLTEKIQVEGNAVVQILDDIPPDGGADG
jgi:phage terminase small subunit